MFLGMQSKAVWEQAYNPKNNSVYSQNECPPDAQGHKTEKLSSPARKSLRSGTHMAVAMAGDPAMAVSV